ncbi:MAG: UMP kinase [Lentisphaeria bacterium]|nr:UMP kinase [Lentisphaeria bacterium]
MGKPYFSRILLKISGEALGGEHGGLEPSSIAQSAQLILEAVRAGAQTAVIIGAGNLFRGLAGSKQGMDRVGADYMGMLATCMNALAMRDALKSAGQAAEIQSALPIAGVLPPFDYREADRMLSEGKVVLFAAGTGHPFFSTDTTAALRALEIRAEAVFKATKVDGIYTADPVTHPEATRYEKLSYDEALAQHLKVMDSNAFALCQDNGLPTVVFKAATPGVLTEILSGDFRHGTLVTAK